MSELYDILGVSRDATDSEIRRAYRKQAIKWHPDKNPENPQEAELQFKLVAEAYEILSDPEKRQVYDAYGLDAVKEGVGAAGHHARGAPGGGFYVDPFELFRTFFQGNDPFSDPFFDMGFGGRRGGGGASPFGASPFGGSPFGGGSMFESMMGGMGMGGMQNFSSMSTSSMGGMGGGVSRSTSTSTVIQNGRRVTRTTTTIRHADGRVETSTDEQVEEGGPNAFLQGQGGGSSFLGW
mmetsp:Transcript_3662/g.6217  ORF Transcript_3662/g.6217 Transcript_3662/m.6217 type:complete len:237 (+) Transcript_3662:53-763(+)